MKKDNVPPYSVYILVGATDNKQTNDIYIYIYIYIYTHTRQLVISALKKVKHDEEIWVRGTLLHTVESGRPL